MLREEKRMKKGIPGIEYLGHPSFLKYISRKVMSAR